MSYVLGFYCPLKCIYTQLVRKDIVVQLGYYSLTAILLKLDNLLHIKVISVCSNAGRTQASNCHQRPLKPLELLQFILCVMKAPSCSFRIHPKVFGLHPDVELVQMC